MTRLRHPLLCAAAFAPSWRRRALLVLLGLSLVNPSGAQPLSMDQLLRLPLQRLLQLEISPRRLPPDAAGHESSTDFCAVERREYEA